MQSPSSIVELPSHRASLALGERGIAKIWWWAVFVGISFWFIHHNWNASERFQFANDFSSAENRTADRVESVNVASTACRTALGLFGFLCLWNRPRGQLRRGGGVLLVFSIFFLLLGLSTIWSINPSVTFKKFIVLGFFSLAALGISRQLTLSELVKVFLAICVSYIAVGIMAEILLGNFAPRESSYRFVGTSHPNTLAGYAVACCLGAVAFGRGPRGIYCWALIVFGIGLITLWLTKSRTSLAGMLVALLAIRIISLDIDRRIASVAIFGLSLVGLATLFFLEHLAPWNEVGEVAAMGRTADVSSLTGRLPLWEELFESIQERPYLGHGYLAYWEKRQIEYLSDLFNWEIPHGHNMYLDILLDVGVVGLILFLLMLGTALFVSFQRYQQYREAGAAFAFGWLIFAVVHGFSESLFKLPTFLLFILVCCVLRLGSLSSQSPEGQTNS